MTALGLAPSPQTNGEPFLARTHIGPATAKRVLPYRLFVPEPAARVGKLPLVVYLHGASGLGTDNLAQISTGGNEVSSRFWVRPEIQKQFPSFVVAPQSPLNEAWGLPSQSDLTPYAQLILELVDKLASEFPIDRDRLYIVGQSRGGIGVWDIITKKPDVFAAAIAMCAFGDPKRVAAARGVKVWEFQGGKDATVFVEGSRTIVAALRAAGGTVKYTEYPDVGHEVWEHAFKEPDVAAWLYAQTRKR
jgi:predicted peptidase